VSHVPRITVGKVIEKVLSRTALSAAALLPLAHLTSLGVMEVSGFILLIASATLFALECTDNPTAALRRLGSGATIPIVGYAVFTLLSVGVMLDQASDQLDALRELKWVLYFFGFLYFFERFWSEGWGRYISLLAGAVALMGLLALCQFVYGWEWPRAESVLKPWGQYFRVTGFFNQPQTFAGNLGMSTFFLLGFALSQFERERWVIEKPPVRLLVSTALGSLGVLLTLTRAAWLGGAVAVVLAFARVRTSWAAITLAVLPVIAGIAWYSDSPIGDRLSIDLEVNALGMEVRQELWEANWSMFQDFPYLGMGPGQNLNRLEDYYGAMSVKYGRIDRAHNNTLEHLAAQGLFVAVFYLIFSGYFLWAAHCLSARHTEDRFVRGIGLGSLVAQIYFHILGLVDSNFFDQEVKNMIVWVWSLTAAMYKRTNKGAGTLGLNN